MLFLILSLVQKLNSIDISKVFMVSIDVVSLFTNIPLQECINLAVSYVTNGNSDLKHSKSDLNKLLTIAIAQTHSLFNGKLYHQVDSMAMGSLLSPVLTNLFLWHH